MFHFRTNNQKLKDKTTISALLNNNEYDSFNFSYNGGYNGSYYGTKYANGASIIDGLIDLQNPAYIKSILLDMALNDAIINSGLTLRTVLFDSVFTITGDEEETTKDKIKNTLLQTNINDKIKKLAWYYYVLGEAVAYFFIDPIDKKLYISECLNTDNYTKKYTLFDSKYNVIYQHGLLGTPQDIQSALSESIQVVNITALTEIQRKIKEEIKTLNKIDNLTKLLHEISLQDAQNTEKDIQDIIANKEWQKLQKEYLKFYENVQIIYGDHFISKYLATEYFFTGSINICASNFPIFINEKEVCLKKENTIILDRSILSSTHTNFNAIDSMENSTYMNNSKEEMKWKGRITQGVGGYSADFSGSLLRSIVKEWLYESTYYRGTMNSIDRRLNPVTCITVGDNDTPADPSTLKTVANDWSKTNYDSSNGAIFITSQMVKSISSINTTIGDRNWLDEMEKLKSIKLLALGINETYLTGTASFNNYESIANIFGQRLKKDQEAITAETIKKILNFICFMFNYKPLDIKWEPTLSTNQIQDINSKIEILKSNNWSISGEYVANSIGLSIKDLQKQGCKVNPTQQQPEQLEQPEQTEQTEQTEQPEQKVN